MRQFKSMCLAAAGADRGVDLRITGVRPCGHARRPSRRVDPGRRGRRLPGRYRAGARPATYRESVTIHTNGLTLKAQGSVTLEPPQSGSSECYRPGPHVGICVTLRRLRKLLPRA